MSIITRLVADNLDAKWILLKDSSNLWDYNLLCCDPGFLLNKNLWSNKPNTIRLHWKRKKKIFFFGLFLATLWGM